MIKDIDLGAVEGGQTEFTKAVPPMGKFREQVPIRINHRGQKKKIPTQRKGNQ